MGGGPQVIVVVLSVLPVPVLLSRIAAPIVNSMGAWMRSTAAPAGNGNGGDAAAQQQVETRERRATKGRDGNQSVYQLHDMTYNAQQSSYHCGLSVIVLLSVCTASECQCGEPTAVQLVHLLVLLAVATAYCC
jgi:hypothetical protein